MIRPIAPLKAPPSLKSTTAAVGALVWISAFVLYAVTAGPGIVELFDDSLEFQYVAPTFGIAHPTGYPLYTIAGGLWTRLLFSFGNWAWRMNLFSAFSAAGAVLFVYLAATRLLPRPNAGADLWAGLAAAAALALGPVWWSQATIAEVYALHGMLMAAILYTALTIPPSPSQSDVNAALRTASRRMTLLSFLVGLSLAHHRMSLLLLPGLAVYLVWSVPAMWRPHRDWLYWLGAFLLPLALYLWLPLRASQGIADLNGSYVNSLTGFLDHVLARGYAGFLGDNALIPPHSLSDVLSLLGHQLGLTAVVLGLAGFVLMPFQGSAARKRWSLLALVLLANFAFGMRYRVADWHVFFIPAILTISLFTGAGVSVISGWLAGERVGRPRLASTVAALLTVLVLAGPIGRAAPVNRSDDWSAHQYAYLLGTVDFPPDSRVIGLEGEMTALRYMQSSENLARNAQPVPADAPEQRASVIAASVDTRHPTYITRELPGIQERYSFSGEGPLVRVWPRGQADAEPPANTLDAELLDGRLRLESYDVRTLPAPGGPILEIMLGWRPTQHVDHNIKVSLRLQDAQGKPIVDAGGQPVVADRFPLRQVAPSTSWLPDELVVDVHHLPLRGLDGTAQVQVIVYDAESIEELARVVLPAN